MVELANRAYMLCSTREQWEDLQDSLFTAYPNEFDALYQFIHRATGKEPTPALMVSRFETEHPDLYLTVVQTLQASKRR